MRLSLRNQSFRLLVSWIINKPFYHIKFTFFFNYILERLCFHFQNRDEYKARPVGRQERELELIQWLLAFDCRRTVRIRNLVQMLLFERRR